MNQAAPDLNAATPSNVQIDVQNEATPLRHFLLKQQCLTTIKLLCQFTKLLQQHRGASMAYLSGDASFDTQLTRLQGDIKNLLLIINSIQRSQQPLLTSQHRHLLSSHWRAILEGWQQDQLIHNFEFHSYLIEELQKMLQACASQLLAMDTTCSGLQPLTDLLFGAMFENIEAMAKLRGLSTNAAIVRACGDESHSRISFLIKTIPDQSQQLLEGFQQLPAPFDDIQTSQTIGQQGKALQRLLLSIQIQILDSINIDINATELFSLSTAIIDSRWQSIGQGVQRIDQQAFDQLGHSPF